MTLLLPTPHQRPGRLRHAVAGLLLFALAVATAATTSGEQYGPVRRGDSLWQIAGQVHADLNRNLRLSRDHIMLALLEANPSAFTPPCNVNGVMKVGAMLRLPTPQQVAERSAQTARNTIQRQSREWREHRRTGLPLTCLATSRTESDTSRTGESAPAQDRPPAAARVVAAATRGDRPQASGRNGASGRRESAAARHAAVRTASR
ncbi:MAG: FimV/HubP family polar landmark protein [Thiohalocapsa sp.]